MKLPLALVFVASSAGAIAAIATSCSSDATCQLYCVPVAPPTSDAGGAVDGPPVTCPACADPVTHACPIGCEPVG